MPDTSDKTQKIIDDAGAAVPAGQGSSAVQPAAVPPVTPEEPAPLPPEPAPVPPAAAPSVPPVPTDPSKKEEKPDPIAAVPVAPPSEPSTPPPVPDIASAPTAQDLSKEQMLEELKKIETVAPAAEPPTVTAVPPAGPPKKTQVKRKSSLPIIAVIVTLLLALPVGVWFVSMQNREIADTRSKAWGTGYQGCKSTPGDPQGTCPDGYVCHCQDGNACTETKCELPSTTYTSCRNQGRAWCQNAFGNGYTCCYPQYECGPNDTGCIPKTGPSNPPNTPPPSTSTPTSTLNPVCQNIKVYKGGSQVTDLTTLRPGDNVTLAVKGNLSPSKAHFRINGGNWTETTTQNAANEFTLAYTIPSGVTQFVIEGEVFTNGAWH